MNREGNEALLETAWQPFQPTSEKPFDHRLAGHLLRRATFGGATGEIDSLVSLGPAKAVEQLLQPTDATAFADEADAMIRTSLVLGDSVNLIDWWLYRLLTDPHGVREKATFLWHGHFCTSRDKVPDAQLLLSQNNTLREHSLGPFAELVKAVSRDAAMLIYLDSTQNRKNRPNENYARELLELFCLGLGNYTEQDIKELARCFTGWEVRRRRFRISRSDHDFGTKNILGTSGAFDGDQAIDVILQQPAVARFVAAKLVRFYVTDDELPPAVIQQLADVLVSANWRIDEVLKTIFTSRLFYSPLSIGRKIAGPLEWTLHWLNLLETRGSYDRLRNALETMGQVPLEPPNVKGWPAGSSWIDPSRMAARVNWCLQLAQQQLAPQGGLDPWLARQGLDDATNISAWVTKYLLAIPLAPSRAELLQTQLGKQKQPADQFRLALKIASVMPEAHVC